MLHNLQQYEVQPAQTGFEPAVLTFLTGKNERQIRASDMFLESIDLEVNGRETHTMQAERKAHATVVIQMFMQFASLGVFQPNQPIQDHRIYSALKAWLLANDVKDWELYLGPEPITIQAVQGFGLLQTLAQNGGANAAQAVQQTSQAPPGSPSRP